MEGFSRESSKERGGIDGLTVTSSKESGNKVRVKVQ